MDFVDAASNFTRTLREVTATLIHGRYPLTQLEMNQHALESAAAMDEALAAVLQKVDPETKNERFRTSQKQWEIFRANEATFVGRMDLDYHVRGSIAPLIYWGGWKSLTKERIDWINSHFEAGYSFDA